MSADDLELRVFAVFHTVAPDIDLASLRRDVAFRDQFDFDSMDTLNFALGLHKAFSLEVPEKDYPRLASLQSAVAYVREHGVTGASGAH
jgi:acyl carrier protein